VKDVIDDHIALWSRELPTLDPRVEGIVTRMSWLDRHLKARLEQALAGQGLKMWEFKTLHILRRGGAPYQASATELADALSLSPAAMTKRLDNLEAGGLLRRGHDDADRRRVLITLTDTGLRVWGNTISLQDQVEKELLAALGPSEQDQLIRLLRRLVVAASPDNLER
jgi:DNA-binding MarR family transcriptional regulator